MGRKVRSVSGRSIQSDVLIHLIEIACFYRPVVFCAISCDPVRNGHRTGTRMGTGIKGGQRETREPGAADACANRRETRTC